MLHVHMSKWLLSENVKVCCIPIQRQRREQRETEMGSAENSLERNGERERTATVLLALQTT